MNEKIDIVVFHPSPFMVTPIDNLLQEIAPELTYMNVIAEDLLDRAQGGLTPEIKDEVKKIIANISMYGNPVVMCSCSTLGGLAEDAGKDTGITVMRIDRPMAELAVSLGKVIGIAAALESTIIPTSKLLNEVATSQSKDIELKEIVCNRAWEYKQAGNDQGYVEEVARCIRENATGLDVIVLAQGSMAGASELLKDLPIRVLSTPRLGVEEIVRMAKNC